MKKFEGILTLCGVALIIGLPMFLMFGSFNDNESLVYSDGYINVLSYDDSVNTLETDFEQSYPALDGTEVRDEIVYLFNETESINDSILEINETIPLGLTGFEEVKAPEPVIIETDPIYIEPEEPEVIFETPYELLEVDFFEEDIIPEGLAAYDPLEETFGDNEEEFGNENEENLVLSENEELLNEDENEVIDIEEDIPEGVIPFEDEEEIDEEETVTLSTEEDEVADPIIEEFSEESFTDEEYNENILEDEVPQGLIALPEEFSDEDNVEITEDEVPEGLTETESEGSAESHEVRQTVEMTDGEGNTYEVETIFLY